MIFEALILGGAAILSTKNVTKASSHKDTGTRLFHLKQELVISVGVCMEILQGLEISDIMVNEKADELYRVRQSMRIAETEKELFIEYNNLENLIVELVKADQVGTLRKERMEKIAIQELKDQEAEILRLEEAKIKRDHLKISSLLTNPRQLVVGAIYEITTRYRPFKGTLTAIEDTWWSTDIILRDKDNKRATFEISDLKSICKITANPEQETK